MTRTEKRIYDSIIFFQLLDGYPPKIMDLFKASGYKNISTVERLLIKLEAQGWIDCTPQRNHWSVKRYK